MTEKQHEQSKEKRKTMRTEDNILLKLTDLLENEKLISAEERNRVAILIEKGGVT